MRARRDHLLHPNDRTWSPHHVIFWDTEFPVDPVSPGEAQPFLCAVALAAHRHGRQSRRRDQFECATFSTRELAGWVEAQVSSRQATWAFAHNLGVDLQASGLLDHLLGRGWRLGHNGLANDSCWAWLRKGRRTLRLCDSASWLPTSEKRLGELVGLPKLPMPSWQASRDAWLRYCYRDAEIGLRSLLELMDWWDQNDCGRWTDTGPGCGWNTMRHRIGSDRILVQQDPRARAFERSGIYAGRREITRRGQLPESQYADLDLRQAHASVAREHPLPAGRGVHFDSMPLDYRQLCGPVVGLIAECEVEAALPRYPLRLKQGICYPTGRFRTVLPGPEIAEARRLGELRRIGPGYAYRLGRWALPFARWLQDVIDGGESGAPGVAVLAARSWSKVVWGRWAMRTTGDLRESDGPHERLVIETGRDMPTGARLQMLHWGYRTWSGVQDQEGDDSFPAVLAWIQSWVRVYVGRLVDLIGADAVMQVATDGVLVAPSRLAEIAAEASVEPAAMHELSDVAVAACRVLSAELGPLEVRLKDVLRRVRLAGPDHLEAEGFRKLSGVPGSWVQVGDWTYEGEVWHSFAVLTSTSPPESVIVGRRRLDLSNVRPLRWVYEDGCCEPLRATLTAAGESVLLPTHGERCAGHGAHLAAQQHPLLTRLLREGPGRAGAELAARPASEVRELASRAGAHP